MWPNPQKTSFFVQCSISVCQYKETNPERWCNVFYNKFISVSWFPIMFPFSRIMTKMLSFVSTCSVYWAQNNSIMSCEELLGRTNIASRKGLNHVFHIVKTSNWDPRFSGTDWSKINFLMNHVLNLTKLVSKMYIS